MINSLLKISFLACLVLAGSAGIWEYYSRFSAQQRIVDLELQNQQLADLAERLGAQQRVADCMVTQQKTIDGVLNTTLLLVEYTPDGKGLAPRSFTVQGAMVHVDALTIQFEQDFIRKNDPLRGHSLALFTRIYGDHQRPEEAPSIDPVGAIPEIYLGEDARITQFQAELWGDFWRLLRDPTYRKSKGVRIAQGEGVWWPPEAGKLYTLSIQTNGGINMEAQEIRGIYREALKNLGT